VADGTPAEHDTTIVTRFALESKLTRAVAAGPRSTPLTSYPWKGDQEIRYAPAASQLATTSPPADVSTVPSPDAGAEAAVVPWTGEGASVADDGGTEGAAGTDAGRAPDGAAEGDSDCSAASLASALLTASWVSSWPELPEIPWPSSELASRQPAVAVAAPSSQATMPKTMRPRMPQRPMPAAKSGLRRR